MSLSWSVEQLAVIVLMAATASVVISIVILAARPALYAYAVLAGLMGGTILRLTTGGHAIGEAADGWLGWLGQPILGAVFALALAVLLDLLTQPQVPLLGAIRIRARRALLPWGWGSSEEIAAKAGVAAWAPGMLGLSVEYRPLTRAQVMMRARSLASVLSWSTICVFVSFPAFWEPLWESITTTSFIVSLCASAFVTFLVAPSEMATSAGDTKPLAGLMPKLAVFLTALTFFVSFEVMQKVLEVQLEEFNLYHWILMLEFCALPLLVTSFFFGATLHRAELGDKRWDKALQASTFAGAIVLAPFPVAYLFASTVDPGTLLTAFGENFYRAALFYALLGFVMLVAGIAIATVVSACTYGVYALALGLALTDASRATVRRRVFVAVMVAGAIMQGVTWLAVWWTGAGRLSDYCLPLAFSFGWAVGLVISRFHDDFPDAVQAGQPATAAA